MTDMRRAVLLTLAIFFLQPLAIGGWLAFIPLVKEALGLSKAELAVALLGMPVATVSSLQVAGMVIGRFGPRRVMAATFPAQGVTILFPFLAWSQSTLFLALTSFGVSMAFLQVCMNVYAGRLEKGLGRSVMNRCHGFWALGLMAGPLIVTALAGLTPIVAVALSAGTAGVIGARLVLQLPRLQGDEVVVPKTRRRIREVPPALAAISLVALAIAITEGAMADWAAVYLSERLPEGSRWVGMGVSIYAGFLAAGRMAGDWMKDRLGAVALARLTYALAIAGLVLLIAPLPLWLAFAGFALVGAGASVGYPLGISASAALDDRYESQNIAIMSSVAISGFLIGPPMIGFLADAYGLRVGLSALIPFLLAGIVLAGWLRPAQRADSAESGLPTRESLG